MDFEFDPKKSIENQRKHGIDFIEAQQLWNSIIVEISATQVMGEPRFLEIGVLSGVYFTAVTTPRGSQKRIISVRRARDYERSAYEKAIAEKNHD